MCAATTPPCAPAHKTPPRPPPPQAPLLRPPLVAHISTTTPNPSRVPPPPPPLHQPQLMALAATSDHTLQYFQGQPEGNATIPCSMAADTEMTQGPRHDNVIPPPPPRA